MEIEVIRQAVRREPYQQLFLKIADGRKFVAQLGSIVVTRTEVILVDPLTDQFVFLKPENILAIE